MKLFYKCDSKKSCSLTALSSALMLVFILSLSAQAQLKPTPLVLVSDIDDTIKISEVLDKEGVQANAMRTENLFRGMAELLTIMKNNYPLMGLVYLTNAQENQMRPSHQKFLSDNGFPDGLLLLRKNMNDVDFKLNRLREILKVTSPRVVILLGDNGESDTQVFDQISKENKQVIFLSYIRQVYYSKGTIRIGQVLADGEMGFVTPIEVAIDLAAKNLMTVPQAQALIDHLAPEIIKYAAMEDQTGRRGELSFPIWQDCRDYQWQPGIDTMQADIQRVALVKTVKDRIQARCSRGPRE